MASYFHGHGNADIQAPEGLQTLYLMNPGYTGFADPIGSSGPTNMVLLNSMSMNSLNPISFSHMSNNQQHFVGIPLQPSSQQDTSNTPPPAPQTQVQYNLWTPPQHMPMPGQQGGLSLTLSSREMSVPSVLPSHHGPNSSSTCDMHGFLMGSKYLKATQEILDEVVSVGKGGIKGVNCNIGKGGGLMESKEEITGMGDEEETVEGKKKTAVQELTTAERQELQMKKAKLVNMLDEVEQRYRQYHHQMQIVAASFEALAGPGSAKTYTSLALQTISKQFRCLRDAITSQIRSTSKSLGEEETKTVGSRLRFIDHHLRQQRALQQLGMIQHNAWRPQRGLPERSVSILRAWLFEHFLHPYPKDSDKIMLAKQTGLTRSQVSNWFINARVRLWKPMVEEMYMEETKDQELNAGTGENSSKTDTDKDTNPNSKKEQKLGATQSNPMDQIDSAPMLAQTDSFYDSDEELMQHKIKKTRNKESYQTNNISNSIGIETQHEEAANNRELLMKFMEGNARAGFGANGYAIEDPIRRFDTDQFTPRYGGNGVSLTLGLPHCDTLPMPGAQSSFLTNEMGTEANEWNNGAPNSSNAYDMNLQSRKSFAAQLLMRNFVA